MKTLFDATDRAAILQRLAVLEPGAARQWGKMDPAQMMTHCSIALEAATGERPMKQKLIGRILAPFVRNSVLGEKPFGHDSPTDPAFIVTGARDHAVEKERLLRLVERFAAQGPATAALQVHAFFGKLSGDEWGTLMYKHLDHHLRQFGG